MDQQPGFRILPRVDTDASLAGLFEGLPASNISDNMNRMPGSAGLQPYHRPGVQLRGVAFTVRVRSGDNLMIHRALQLAKPGDVLVIDGEGCIDRALIGEIMKNVAQSRGLAGAVVDGAIRDVAAFRSGDWPCYARAVCHRGPYKDGPGEINVQVTVGGMEVNPGDVIIGDDDGVVAIPPREARAVAEATRKKAAAEAATLKSIAERRYDDAWIEKTLKAKGL